MLVLVVVFLSFTSEAYLIAQIIGVGDQFQLGGGGGGAGAEAIGQKFFFVTLIFRMNQSPTKTGLPQSCDGCVF